MTTESETPQKTPFDRAANDAKQEAYAKQRAEWRKQLPDRDITARSAS